MDRSYVKFCDSKRFTLRDRKILVGLMNYLSNKEVGACLGISENCVKQRVWRIYNKARVRSRTQLIRLVLEDRLAREAKRKNRVRLA